MASILLNHANKISTTVDIFQHAQVCNERNSLSCIPPLFYEHSWSTGAFDSLIHPKKIRLDFLQEKSSDDNNYKAAQDKLKSHKKHTSVYNILGLGHPRCGSGYTAKLLKALGLNVGHEKLESDGIVSWMFASDDDAPWALNEGAKSKKFKYFKHTIHHVRNPQTAIPSIIRDDKHSEISHQFRRDGILRAFSIDIDNYETPLERATASFVYWNKLVTLNNPDVTYRIEDQENILIDYLSNNGIIDGESLDPMNLPLPEKNVNANKAYLGKHYEKPTVCIEEYLLLPDELLNSLNDYCRSYNYPVFEKTL